jgi:hypothetical protein
MSATTAPFSSNQPPLVSHKRAHTQGHILRRSVSKHARLSAHLSERCEETRKGLARILSHILKNRRGLRCGIKSLSRMACCWAA